MTTDKVRTNEINKPKTFRNRKKITKKEGDYIEHPKHRPYERPANLHHNLLLEDTDLDN